MFPEGTVNRHFLSHEKNSSHIADSGIYSGEMMEDNGGSDPVSGSDDDDDDGCQIM